MGLWDFILVGIKLLRKFKKRKCDLSYFFPLQMRKEDLFVFYLDFFIHSNANVAFLIPVN